MNRRTFFKRTAKIAIVTPFVPITERLLGYVPEEAKAPVEAPTLKYAHVEYGLGFKISPGYAELLKPGLKKAFYDAYKDFPEDAIYPGKMIFIK